MYARRLLPLALVLPLFTLCAQKGGIAQSNSTVAGEARSSGLDNKAGAAEEVRRRPAGRFNLHLTQVAGSVWIVYAEPGREAYPCKAGDPAAGRPAMPAADAATRDWLLWLWLSVTDVEVCW